MKNTLTVDTINKNLNTLKLTKHMTLRLYVVVDLKY